MKRIHLFEFEDFAWFPNWLRKCMTRYIVAVHRMMATAPQIAELLTRILPHAPTPHIVDLCSGSGGPLPSTLQLLHKQPQYAQLKVTLTDLYPNDDVAREIRELVTPGLHYRTSPVDATSVDPDLVGVRTMICSLHHMRPELARKILGDAQRARQPFCAYEISDNSPPIWLWWLAIPINILVVLLLTPMVRPLTWRQIVFTYLIPLLPLFIAWDGAVSNARTYTVADMEELVAPIKSDGYTWEYGSLDGKMGKKVYLLGYPQAAG